MYTLWPQRSFSQILFCQVKLKNKNIWVRENTNPIGPKKIWVPKNTPKLIDVGVSSFKA